MTDTIHHGLTFAESATGTRYLQTRSQSVLGFPAVASDADATTFPLNTPVLVTDVRAAIAKAGVAGTLAATLQTIADQANAVAIVVRTAEGTGEDADDVTEANMVAAVEKLLHAKSLLGVAPRVLGAPGYDNQVVAEKLAEVAGKLRGFAYASAAGEGADTVAEAATYRAQFSARELMLLYPNAKRGNLDVTAVALALGLRAQIDATTGWHKTISNVPLKNVTSIERPVTWDFEDGANDAALLNEAQITAIINHNGYRFWGNRTCSADAQWAFESGVRTHNAIRDTIAEGTLWAADLPLHPSLARDVINMLNGKFDDLARPGAGRRIMGARAWIDPIDNPTVNLNAGKLAIRYEWTEIPPLEDLTITSTKSDVYFADFAQQAAA